MCGRYVSPEEAAIEREWVLTRIGDQPVLGVAAMWDVSIEEDGSATESCAVITVPGDQVTNDLEFPNGEVTGRMPAILTRQAQEVWLRGAPAEAFACLKPGADELTIAYPVCSRVNSPKNSDAGLGRRRFDWT